MKSFLALALILAVAVCNPTAHYAWRPNREIVFRFETEHLVGIPQIRQQYGGIKMATKVIVQTFNDYSLRIKFVDPKFITVNQELTMGPNGRPMIPKPEQEIPEPMQSFLEKPFEVHYKAGVVESVFVEQNEPVVVTNIKKAFLSQIQMDLAGIRKVTPNHIRAQQDEESLLEINNISYFTTEETSLVGDCETSYSVHQLPKYQVLDIEEKLMIDEREVRDLGELKGLTEGDNYCNGKKYYQITKVKNFDKCKKRPLFQATTGIKNFCDGSKSSCEDIMTQSLTTTYLVCGESLEDFVIRKISTDSNSLTNPLGWNNTPEKMVSNGRLNVWLLQVKESGYEPLPKPQNPKQKSSLIFDFPVHDQLSSQGQEEFHGRVESNEEFEPILPMPDMRSTPFSIMPRFLPVEELMNQVIEAMKKIIVEVFESPESCSSRSDIAGYVSAISRSLRSLNYEELKQLDQKVRSAFDQNIRSKDVSMDMFNDILAMIGTNPSILLIKEKIVGRQVMVGTSDLNVLQNTIRNVRTPTKEVFKTLLEMVKFFEKSSTESTKKQMYNNGLISLSNLVYRACVNPASVIADFPVRIYGHFCYKKTEFITEEYIPYLISMLERSNMERSEHLVYISALGKIGHKEIIKTLAKVIEGKMPQHQNYLEHPLTRSLGVYSLKRLAKRDPALVRPVLTALINNIAEKPEVRIAAIAVLPWTQPPTAMLQQLALKTWFEPSKQVAAFIKSTLYSLIETEVPELKPVGLKAFGLVRLVKPVQFGFQYSHNSHNNKFVKYLSTASSIETSYVVSEESLIPSRLSLSARLFGNSWELQGVSFSVFTQGMDALVDQIFVNLGYKSEISEKVREQLKHINDVLNIKSERNNTSFEALIQMRMLDMEIMYPINNRLYGEVLEKVAEEFRSNPEVFSNSGLRFHKVHALTAINIIMYGPSASGFPIYLQRNMPVVFGIKGWFKSETQEGFRSKVSANIVPVINGKTQSDFGVISPFTKEFIGAGVETSVHLSMPFTLELSFDKRGKLNLIVKNPEDLRKQIEVIHAFIKPYTVIKKLDLLKPISKATNLKVILSGQQETKIDMPIGRALGLDAKLKVETDRVNADVSDMFNHWTQHNFGSLINNIFMASTVRSSSFKIEYNPESSTTKEVETNFNILWGQKQSGEQLEEQVYPSESDLVEMESEIEQICRNKHGSSYKVEKCMEEERESLEHHRSSNRRVKEILRNKLNGAGSVLHGISVEGKLREMSGNHKTIKTVILGGSEKVGPFEYKSIFEILFKTPERPVYEFEMETKTKLPLVSTRWNLQQLIDEQIKMESVTKIKYGRQSNEKKEIVIESDWVKTEEMKRSILSSPEMRKCQQMVQEDRKLSSVCEEVRHQAASVDKVVFKLRLPETLVLTKNPIIVKLENLFKGYFLSQTSVQDVSQRSLSGENRIYEIETRFSRKGDVAQVEIKTPTQKYEVKNVRIPLNNCRWIPLSLRNGVEVRLLQDISRDQDPASCRLDHTIISSFDNKTYKYDINECEHLLFKDCSMSKLYRPVAVLAKKVNENKRHVKILSGTNIILLKPESREVTVLVNDETKSVSVETPFVKRSTKTGKIELIVKRSQDGVVSVINPVEGLEVFFDGVRIEIVAPQMLRHRTCGLCGDLNGEHTADLRTPEECIMSKPKLAAYSYMLQSGENHCSGIPSSDVHEYEKEKKECVKKHQIITKLQWLVKSIRPRPVSGVHLVQVKRDEICVSKKMVRICGHGSKPLHAQHIEMPYVCLNKYTAKGQQILERSRAGDNLEVEVQPLSVKYTKRVVQPVACSKVGGSNMERIESEWTTLPSYEN